MTKSMMGQEFAEVALQLDSGSVSHPLKTKFGWFLLKVEDKRERKPVAFEAVQDKLKLLVARRAQLQLISSLRSEAKIELVNTLSVDKAPAEAAR